MSNDHIVAFSAYLRPSELVAIKRRDLVQSSRFVMNHCGLVVVAREFDHRTSSGTVDGHVALDVPWLG